MHYSCAGECTLRDPSVEIYLNLRVVVYHPARIDESSENEVLNINMSLDRTFFFFFLEDNMGAGGSGGFIDLRDLILGE